MSRHYPAKMQHLSEPASSCNLLVYAGWRIPKSWSVQRWTHAMRAVEVGLRASAAATALLGFRDNEVIDL